MGLFSLLFDRKFEKDIHKYNSDSYLKDLNSKNRDKKIRAIWGVEGMGNKSSIEKLQSIVKNKREDRWVRKEAGISIKNLRKQK